MTWVGAMIAGRAARQTRDRILPTIKTELKSKSSLEDFPVIFLTSMTDASISVMPLTGYVRRSVHVLVIPSTASPVGIGFCDVLLWEWRKRRSKKRGITPLSESPWAAARGRYYFAKSIARVSRITFTLIWPGYSISRSIRLTISLAKISVPASLTSSGLTMMRISRPD